MKDSQLRNEEESGDYKYIKANNERFSTRWVALWEMI